MLEVKKTELKSFIEWLEIFKEHKFEFQCRLGCCNMFEKKKHEVKSCTEICSCTEVCIWIEKSQAKRSTLLVIDRYIRKNKYKYPLVELQYMQEMLKAALDKCTVKGYFNLDDFD